MVQEDQAKELDNLLGSEEEEPTETEEGEEEEGEEKEEKEEFVMPEKFKGKSAEEIAKSYTELEKMIERKAEERAAEILKEKSKEEAEEKIEEEEEITPPMIEGKVDFASMTPDQFAEWILQEVEKRAEEKAKKVYEESTKIKESVSTEIAEAQENHPLLKTSNEYRELVLAIIESAASKGEIVSLEDACKKVDALIGQKEEIGKKEEEKLKKAKAVVEKGGGAPIIGTPETEEERIRQILSPKAPSGLGGLGI